MSFFRDMFGGGEAPKPKPVPAAPRIGDAEGMSLARAEQARLKRKKGVEDTILTRAQGLGDVGGESGGTPANIQRTSLLGGG